MLPFAIIMFLIGLFGAMPVCFLMEIANATLKEAIITTAITWGVIFILKILAEAIDHGEKLVRAEETKGSVGKNE